MGLDERINRYLGATNTELRVMLIALTDLKDAQSYSVREWHERLGNFLGKIGTSFLTYRHRYDGKTAVNDDTDNDKDNNKKKFDDYKRIRSELNFLSEHDYGFIDRHVSGKGYGKRVYYSSLCGNLIKNISQLAIKVMVDTNTSISDIVGYRSRDNVHDTNSKFKIFLSFFGKYNSNTDKFDFPEINDDKKVPIRLSYLSIIKRSSLNEYEFFLQIKSLIKSGIVKKITKKDRRSTNFVVNEGLKDYLQGKVNDFEKFNPNPNSRSIYKSLLEDVKENEEKYSLDSEITILSEDANVSSFNFGEATVRRAFQRMVKEGVIKKKDVSIVDYELTQKGKKIAEGYILPVYSLLESKIIENLPDNISDIDFKKTFPKILEIYHEKLARRYNK